MSDFFSVRDASDPIYRIVAANADLAAHVNALWKRVEPCLDARRPEMAARAFHATYWEMYLASVLEAIWIEAITPEEGKTEDRVPPVLYDAAMNGNVAMQTVPDRELLLRVHSAIEAKRDVYASYLRKGYVAQDEPYAIAVSGSALPFGNIDTDIPRIVRVAFGLSDLVVTVDRDTGAVVSEGYPPLLKIPLKSRDVHLALFARPEYSFISALIWGSADVANQLILPGQDLVVVHNPKANVPLPLGWIPQGREYWVEDDELKQRAWFREHLNAG